MPPVKKASAKPKVKKTDSGGQNITNIDLPPQLDISSANAFHQQIIETYKGANINLNASKLERITTPGVQIIISTSLTAKSRGGKMTIVEVPEIFKNVVSDLGFSNQLQEWMDSNV